MDFGTRGWLTVIIGLAILAVVLDGVRRMRQNRRNSIKMSAKIDTNGGSGSGGESKTYGSELPGGGARVVTQRDETAADEFNKRVRKAYSASRTTSGFKIPEQVSLNLDESVPMLMDSVAEPKTPRKGKQPQEPTLGDISDLDESLDETGQSEELPQSQEPQEPLTDSDSPADDYSRSEPSYKSEADLDEAPNDSEPQELREPDEVLVINVMAPSGYYFAGNDLLEVAIEAGMRFGEMNIFHRHQEADGKGPILFSMANIVTPGTFDLQTMDEFKTPGVSLFLALPCKVKSMVAFDLLYDVAKYLADNLGGELKDEQRSVLKNQTVEHYRERVRDYERKRLTMSSS